MARPSRCSATALSPAWEKSCAPSLGRKRERLRARDILTAHLASVLRTMALDGRGLAWLPALLIQDDLAAGRLAVAAPDDWSVPLEIRLYRPRGPISEAAEVFWKSAASR